MVWKLLETVEKYGDCWKTIQTEKADGLAACPKTSQGRICDFHGPVLRDLRQNAHECPANLRIVANHGLFILLIYLLVNICQQLSTCSAHLRTLQRLLRLVFASGWSLEMISSNQTAAISSDGSMKHRPISGRITLILNSAI